MILVVILTKVCYRHFIKTPRNHINWWVKGALDGSFNTECGSVIFADQGQGQGGGIAKAVG